VNELSLFTGAGGGLLGSLLLGHTIVGAVEYNEYCCRVLEARQRDGHLAPFPIFQTDIRDFVRSGYASLYKGRCDLVSGGFPCQPFSVAGKQQCADDERNMWPATRDVIRIVQPRSVLLENVPGLVSCGYLGTVIADLAALGYVGKWGVIGACDAGAPHKRDRLWIVAHAKEQSGNGRSYNTGFSMGPSTISEPRDGDRPTLVADAHCAGEEAKRYVSGVGRVMESITQWQSDPSESVYQPIVGRVAHGVAYRMDRLKAIGNGQVPFCVEMAWRMLA